MEKAGTEKKCSLTMVLMGLAVAVGPALAGYFISQGITNFKNSGRALTVKGLYAEEVKADHAIWDLNFVVSSDELPQAQAKSQEDSQKIMKFLLEQGLAKEDIFLGRMSVRDAKAPKYYMQEQKGDRFVIESSIRVATNNVDLVMASLNKIPNLIKEGVLIDSGEPYGANPAFFYKKFEERRPEMFTKAVKSAQEMAYKFTGDTHTKLGHILQASQGTFEIRSSNQTDEDHKKSPFKSIRLVTTITFALE